MRFNDMYSALQSLTYGNVSQSEIARILGVSRSNINYKKDNNVNLSDDDVLKIETHFEVSLRSYNNDDVVVNIPVRGDVEASMGYGVTVYNELQTATFAISRKFANDLGISATQSEIIYARGNSMLPTIENGDSLLIDRSKQEIYDGKIFCIRLDGQIYAKRLQKLTDKKIKVISDNKDYEPIIIDFEKNINYDFAVIGEVRWVTRIMI